MAVPVCNSTLHRVEELLEPGLVLARDLAGTKRQVSLLALDGPPPQRGDWLVVHSGYAISRAERRDAEVAVAELDAANEPPMGQTTH